MRSVSRLALPLAGTILALSLPGQGDWQYRSAPNVPTQRTGAMAYDSVRQVMVLVVDQETWEWNGSSWQIRGLLTAAPTGGVALFSLSYDPVRERMVLYGGQHANGATGGATYEWDGTILGWTHVAQPPADLLVGDHAMEYVAPRQRHILFGGVVGFSNGRPEEYSSATWSWNGSSWINLNPPTSPAPRHGHEMAHDLNSDRVILFGGKAGEEIYPDTWGWDGTNWTELFPSTSPPARHGHTMAYDSARERILLFGGKDENGVALNDSWEWDGDNWSPVNPASRPARRFDASMDYDSARDVMVLFGGSNGAVLRDTWEYTAGSSASYTTFGTGCPGPQGIPTLGPPFGGSLPIAGQSFSVQVNNLPLDATTWMLLGPSTTQYGLLTLPYDLGNIGIFGCTLWVSGEFVFPVTSVLGVGLWTLDIPAFAAGWTFHNQAVVFDTAGNVMVSDGGTLVIGG